MNIYSNEDGGVMAIFGLVIIVLFGVVGVALDFKRTVNLASDFQHMIDGAALAGAREGALQKSVQEIIRASNAHLDAQCAKAGNMCPMFVSRSVDVDGNTVTVDAQITSPTTFSTLIGLTKFEPRILSTGAFPTVHLEIDFLIDATGSMDIVDGAAARSTMLTKFTPGWSYNNVSPGQPGQGCAFACHKSGNHTHHYWERVAYSCGRRRTCYRWELRDSGRTGAQIAAANGLILRDERLRSNLQQVLTDVFSHEHSVTSRFFTMKMQGEMGAANENVPLMVVEGGANNLPNAQAIVSGFSTGDYKTGIKGLFDQYMATNPMPGLGTAESPKRMVVFITDGVDHDGRANSDVELFKSEHCDIVKSQKLPLIIMNLKYPSSTTITTWPTRNPGVRAVSRFQTRIPGALRACATDPDEVGIDTYFEADWGQQMKRELEKLVREVLNVRGPQLVD